MPDIYVAPKNPPSSVDVIPARHPNSSFDNKQSVGDEKKKEVVKPEQLVETKPASVLSAYALYPENVRFDTQEEEEQIILLLRRHWITNFHWLVATSLLIFLPPVVFPSLVFKQLLPSLSPNFFLIFISSWYLLTFGYALLNFIVWYFNVYIVTDKRIIDVDFYQLLYKQMSSTRVSRVQDLTYKLSGVIRAIFDYGDVSIQTAGELPNFHFEAVPHPEQVVRIISELTEKKEEEL